jgi:predicted  nucleic acid-binding Zn-ribbon protein
VENNPHATHKKKGIGMSENPFRNFIDLIQYDQATLAIEKSVAQLMQEIDVFNKQELHIKKEIEESKNIVSQAQKEVDRIELEMKSMDQSEKTKKERIENATDYKQYQSLKNEIDTLKRKQHENEELLLGVWNQLEIAKKNDEKLKVDHLQKLIELEQSVAENLKKIEVLQAQFDERIKHRSAHLQNIPEEWLDKYAMMRSRISDPVVPVINGNCGGCFYGIPEHDLMQLRRRKLLQCKGCYRLLYSTEIEQ